MNGPFKFIEIDFQKLENVIVHCVLYAYVIFPCIRNSLKLCETAQKFCKTGTVNRKKRVKRKTVAP